jgi:hypothetical protein
VKALDDFEEHYDRCFALAPDVFVRGELGQAVQNRPEGAIRLES